MSYLLDKKEKRKKTIIALSAAIILFLLFEWRSAVFSGLSGAAGSVFHSVLSVGNGFSEKTAGYGSYFASKNSLFQENQKLHSDLDSANARMDNYNTLLSENEKMKEILGRMAKNRKLVIASIMAGADSSLYNTLIIDAGVSAGVSYGDTVFAYGDIPIGKVAEADAFSSKVVLFTGPGESTQAFIHTGALPALPQAPAESPSLSASSASGVSSGVMDSSAGTSSDAHGGGLPSATADGNPPPSLSAGAKGGASPSSGKSLLVELSGRGGGNFEMEAPRDVSILVGAEAVMPGITPYVLGKVAAVISDPRDAIQKFLLTAPVNVRELKFVEVEVKK